MRRLLSLACVLFAFQSPARGQGEFVNFEAPQVAPITVVEIAQRSFVLACNTPDNSVEVYDAATKNFVLRVSVGLSPVTVRWNAGQLYTCNFVGDSVSVVSLQWVEGRLRGRLERSVHVGDEPTDIAFESGTGVAWVALHSRSQVARVDALTLAPAPSVPGQTHLKVLEIRDAVTPSLRTAVKAPRRLALLDDGRFLGLNTMGGNTGEYDFDLFVEDVQMTPDTVQAVGGMGSTNAAFALSADGDRLLVVGGVAQNHVLGETMLRDEPLGFVRYFLWTLPVPNTGVPWAPPVEQNPDTSSQPNFPLWASIDLNRDYTLAGMEPIAAVGSRVSQPTDVLTARDSLGVEHVLLAMFGSDEVMILTPDSSANGGWTRRHVDVPPLPGGTSTGPRGLAFDAQQGVVWILNRLDNSLAWFPLLPSGTPSVTRVDLQRDPTPDSVRLGRPFLYSAHLTSGNQIVSCSSCHIDGRTDGLQWNLGDPGNMSSGPPIPPELIDEVPYLTHFSPDKGVLITQSLQGLVNSQIDSRALQYVTTNAPYHWRGDRLTFADFNVAFVNLQGRSDPLETDEMEAYNAFVDGIHYPANPEQPITRTYGGSMGQTPQELDSEDVGSGALYGMKLFHIRSSASGRSCVQCHTLPEGSSNTFVLDTAGPKVPLENAAMRGLFQREKALVDDFDVTRDTAWTRISDFGLTRNGVGVTQNGVSKNDERSLNDFIAGFSLGSGPQNKSLARHRAVVEFARKFDWGTAPMVGRTMTYSLTDALDASLLTEMEQSAEQANSGLAVFVRRNNGARTQGYWYDCASDPPVFRRVGGVRTLTEAALLALVQTPNDLIVFQSTPTGSERRVAHLQGNPAPLPGPAPSGIELLPMVPNTAYEPVTQLDAFVDPHPTPGDPRSQSIEQRLVMESAVRNAAFDFGVAGSPRHEPPRRFRVAGHDIRHGAKLRLGVPVGASGSGQFATLELDLAATVHRHGLETKVVWESTEELDARMTMAFLCGGPELTEVAALLGGDLSASLNPDLDNMYQVEIVNQDGSAGTAAGLRPLLLGDDR